MAAAGVPIESLDKDQLKTVSTRRSNNNNQSAGHISLT